MSPIAIRPASVLDAASIRDLHVASIRGLCDADYSPEEIQAWATPAALDDYRGAIASNPFLVAEVSERIAGFAELDVARQEVKAVYVLPSNVRQGIARALVHELERVARELGLTHLWLDSSLTAAPFYRQVGFMDSAKTSHQLSSGSTIACIKMTKEI